MDVNWQSAYTILPGVGTPVSVWLEHCSLCGAVLFLKHQDLKPYIPPQQSGCKHEKCKHSNTRIIAQISSKHAFGVDLVVPKRFSMFVTVAREICWCRITEEHKICNLEKLVPEGWWVQRGSHSAKAECSYTCIQSCRLIDHTNTYRAEFTLNYWIQAIESDKTRLMQITSDRVVVLVAYTRAAVFPVWTIWCVFAMDFLGCCLLNDGPT